MSFDWEYLLGAEGEDIQAAYEDRMDDGLWDDYYDSCEDESGDWDDILGWDDEELEDLVPNTCTAGEVALASSEQFRTHRLRLYRNLSCSGLPPADYIIGTDRAPILKVNLTDDPDPRPTMDSVDCVPVLKFPREHMRTGQVEAVLSYLSGLLCRPPAMRNLGLEPISLKRHARMAKLHMIRQQEDYIWVPTPYGASLGIIDGYVTMDRGKPCHTFFLLSASRSRLEEAMSWGGTPPGNFRPQLSWDQTLSRVFRGLPRSDGYAASVARAFASMPLKEYMAGCQHELDDLCLGLGLDEDATYQQAASSLYESCMASNGSEEVRSRCVDMILSLIRPLILALNNTKRPAY